MPNYVYQSAFAVTPAQFAQLLAAVKWEPEVQHYAETTPLTGSISTHEANFDYIYDGAAWLQVNVISLNTFLARRMPKSLIRQSISDEIQKLAAPATSAS